MLHSLHPFKDYISLRQSENLNWYGPSSIYSANKVRTSLQPAVPYVLEMGGEM